MVYPCNTDPFTSTNKVRGFTLIELMIALFISGLIAATIISIYIAQTRSYSQHDDIANIQQGLRGALIVMPLDIRLAGCDPTESNEAGIITATATQFRFTRDITGNPVIANSADGDVDDPGEDIAFQFSAIADQDDNGIVDNGGADWSGTSSLGRASGGAIQPLADNIEALEFNYTLDDGSTTLAPTNPNKIRTIQVTLLARATHPAKSYVHTKSYTTASGVVWTPPNDNFRRRLVVTNIQLRNMGY